MARLPLVDPDDPGTDLAARAALLAARERAGRDFNVYRAVANHPAVFEGLLSLTAAARSSLTPAQRELAYTTATVTNDCHY